MPTIVHTTAGEPEPDEPDRPHTTTTQPYWRRQAWRPPGDRDTAGMIADLFRRLCSALVPIRWWLTLDVCLYTFVDAPDQPAVARVVADALRHPNTIIALSRAEPDAIPPWRPLGTADRMDRCTDVHAVNTGAGTWKCATVLLLRFAVDVGDASWPDRDYAVDVVPARTEPRLLATAVTTPVILGRRPALRRRPRRSAARPSDAR